MRDCHQPAAGRVKLFSVSRSGRGSNLRRVLSESPSAVWHGEEQGAGNF